MRIQVVHCHPLVDSYDHALFHAIVESLRVAGHEVIATDLYRERFDPVMSEDERRSYMANEYAGQAVARHIETLRTIDGIVFCYPHWWFSMPAMLKGYVDRVWAPGTAFIYDAKDNHLEPNLRRIRFFGVVTTYGSPWWIVRLFAGDAGRKVMMRGLKPMCARGARSLYLAHYDMDHSTEESRRGFLEEVRRRFARIP